MLNRISIGAIALVVAMWTATADAQMFDLGKFPDWSGQWRRVPDGGPPRYDPSKPDGLPQQPPLKPEYMAKLQASLKDIEAGGQGENSTYKCIPTGMPRMMSGVFPHEFVFTPATTFILFEFMINAPRRIYTDGRDFPKTLKQEEPTFVGYSIGKWVDVDGDGRYDELQAETRHIREPRTYDQAGIPFAEDGETIVKERFYLDKSNPDIMHSEMTTIDNALTRPWTITKNFRRDRSIRWSENNCTEGNMHVVVGSENYFLSGDGHLMPARKDQPPPDLRYFKPVKK
jgi:hypothetical protein